MEPFDEKDKYLPMLAGMSQYDFFTEENIQMWKTFRTFPAQVQTLLKSREIAQFIFKVEQRYRLNDAQTEDVARSVRRYFFREVTEQEFVQHIASSCGIAPTEVQAMLKNILAIQPAQEQPASTTTEQQLPRHVVQLPLEQALRQYPAIKDQAVTDRQIAMRSLPQALKPSVKNWIMVYERVLGASKHTTIERGEFIFRSEPTRGLSQADREKLTILLKSRDEDTPLVIDRDQKIIVFDADPSVAAQHTPPTAVHRSAPLAAAPVSPRQSSPQENNRYDVRNAVQNVRSMGGFVPRWGQSPDPQQVRELQRTTPRPRRMTQPSQASQPLHPRHAPQPPRLAEQSRQQHAPQPQTAPDTPPVGRAPISPQHSTAMVQSGLLPRRSLEPAHAQGLPDGYGAQQREATPPRQLPTVPQSSLQGSISFSSNHNLPIERKKHTTLQPTKKYLTP